MNVEITIEWLESIKKNNISIKRHQELIDEIKAIQNESRDIGVKNIIPNKTQDNSYNIANPTQKKAIEAMKFDNDIDRHEVAIKELKSMIDEANQEIEGLYVMNVLNENQYRIIRLFYFQNKSVKKIATELTYSSDWIYKLKTNAIYLIHKKRTV